MGDRDLIVDIETYPTAWALYRPGAERRIRSEMARVLRDGQPTLLECCRVFFGEKLCRRARTLTRGRAAAARRALEWLRPVVANCEALGKVWTTTYVRSWCAEALRLAGEMEKAESEAMRVLASERDFGVNHCLILGHQVLAHVLESRGELSRARTHARDALRVAERMECGCVGVAHLELSLQETASGNARDAQTLRSRAFREIRERGYPDELRYALREGKQRELAPTINAAGRRSAIPIRA